MHSISLFILTLITITYALPLRHSFGADNIRRHMKRDIPLKTIDNSTATVSQTATASSTAPLPSSTSGSAGSSGSSNPKLVVAHHMVGNTYPYVVQDWEDDINLAFSSGIDAFALNIGTDSWQPQQVANAYVFFVP
jgi:hypothetical protein